MKNLITFSFLAVIVFSLSGAVWANNDSEDELKMPSEFQEENYNDEELQSEDSEADSEATLYGNYICFAKNAFGYVFRAIGYNPHFTQGQAINICLSRTPFHGRPCFAMGCRYTYPRPPRPPRPWY